MSVEREASVRCPVTAAQRCSAKSCSGLPGKTIITASCQLSSEKVICQEGGRTSEQVSISQEGGITSEQVGFSQEGEISSEQPFYSQEQQPFKTGQISQEEHTFRTPFLLNTS